VGVKVRPGLASKPPLQRQKITMKLILETTSSDENYNGDCDYATVELTPNLAKLALRRIKALKQIHEQDDQIWEMYFWDDSSVFFEGHDELESFTDAETGEACVFSRNVPFHAAAEFKVPADHIQRTECNQMIVREEEIAWTAIPKHSSVYVTTMPIPLTLLEKAALQ